MLIPCATSTVARHALLRLSSGAPHWMSQSNVQVRGSAITVHADPSLWKEDCVAFGVYYQIATRASHKDRMIDASPPCFDFWGFVPGNVVRLASLKSEKVVLYRNWFAPTIDSIVACDPSFDLYRDPHFSDPAEISLDDIHYAVQSRASIYHAITNRKQLSALLPRHRDILQLQTPAAIRIDKLGYFCVLAFLSNAAHAIDNPQVHRNNLEAWRKVEISLAMYRITYCMNAAVFGSRLKGFAFESVVITKELIVSAGAAEFMKVDQTMIKIPFERGLDLLSSRSAVLHKGFLYADSFYLFQILINTCKDYHIANEVELRNEGRVGSLDGFFRDERMVSSYRVFLGSFSAWVVRHAAVVAVGSVVSKDELLAARLRLRRVFASAPSCMTVLASRAVNLKDPTHNTFKDRKTFTQFMLRMNVSLDLLEPLLRAKVQISYERPDTEWKSLSNELEWEEKVHRNPRPGKSPFTPSCYWIINGGKSPSNIECPYATKLRVDHPRLANDPTGLFRESVAACGREFTKETKLKPAERAKGPDEYTARMMSELHRLDEAKRNVAVKRKSAK